MKWIIIKTAVFSIICFLVWILWLVPVKTEAAALKILHLTFHKGCAKEIEGIAQELNVELKTWFIPALAEKDLDGETTGNAIYNLGHERAEKIWKRHRHTFEQFDLIITSDTAPLSRIFLQNGWEKPLVIWICNRFDYCDQASLDCDFPDDEFYELFREATQKQNVAIVAYTPFEHYYTKSKGVDTGSLLIKPCAPSLVQNFTSSIPPAILKQEYFFLPPYHNEQYFIDLSSLLAQWNIPAYCGRYAGPYDLQGFKGIIHLPYTWSSLAFFENMQLGIPYFVPSPAFLEKLVAYGNYFHPNLSALVEKKLYDLSEWYAPEHQDIITYFDSWEDLKKKTEEMDYAAQREKIRSFAVMHKEVMIGRWKKLLEQMQIYDKSNQ